MLFILTLLAPEALIISPHSFSYPLPPTSYPHPCFHPTPCPSLHAPYALPPPRAPKLPILVCGRYDTAPGPVGAKIHTTDASLVIHCCYDNELGPLNNASG